MVARLSVRLGERGYPIWFGDRAEQRLKLDRQAAEADGRRLVVITDQTVQRACARLLSGPLKGLPVLALAGGEPAKSAANLAGVWEFLAEQKLDRSGVVIALGGGVIGDLAGFAAAGYQRGIDFWQIPTSLLAMVDSSVGGKTGINLIAGKNLAGAFHQPRAVYIQPSLLRSLPKREFAAGMAEVLKYGLLADGSLFRQLAAKPLGVHQTDRLASVVRRCCAIKAAIVEKDEFERSPRGGRALLNLGHTFGHAIEKACGYGRLLHGEAVAIGLVAAARLSQELGLVKPAVVYAVTQALKAHGLPVRLQERITLRSLMDAMQRDKKVRAGKLRFVVLNRIGQADTRDSVESGLVEHVWRQVGVDDSSS